MSTQFEIWLIGYLFTMGLRADKDDGALVIIILFFVWPNVLGVQIRKQFFK